MKVPRFPRDIQIEVCNFCNARCVTCPVPRMKRKHAIMDFELFKKIMGELEEKSFDGCIFPFLSGESLLVPNFADYLEFIKAKVPKAEVCLYTNASKLDDEIGRRILKDDLLDTLTVSFDGGTKESYESVRRGLSFEIVKENVHSLIYNRNKMGKREPAVVITMVVTPENRHTKKELTDEFKDADRVNFSFMFNWGGQLKKETRARSFLTKCNFCPRMWQSFTILVNGDAALCCIDYEGKEIVGNIREDSIEEIWLGEKFEIKRKQLTKREFNKLPLCIDCSFINHNLIVQPLFKIRPLIEMRFPQFAMRITDLYKSIVGFRK